LTRFLLRHDQSASTMPDHHGNLPLHLACHYSNFSVAKILYDAYPQAITMQNNDQETPSDLAPRCNSSYNHVSGSGLVFEWFIETQLEWKGRAQGIVEPDANGQLPIHLLLQKPEPPLGTIKLMADANRASLTTADNQGFLPLHVSCKFGHLDIFKYLSGSDEDSLKTKTSRGYLPLHIACLAGKCHVVNYILERSDFGVASRIHGKLPLELLLSNVANGDRNNLEFVEAVFRLLRANPEIIYKWDVADNLNFDDLKLEWARRKSMRLQSLDNFFKNYSL
jgi:ankyrin